MRLKMIYKQVPKIGEKISALGVGCWNMGGDWDTSNENNAITVIRRAIDEGINFFDVAPVYGWGVSETVLGKALKEGGLRDKVLIASKAGLIWNEKHETKNDLSKASLLQEIDNSLCRLQTDHIDIYQMHWPDHNVPLEETADALNILRKSGKIRFVGLSNYSQKDMETMMTMTRVDCQQGLYNMLERNASSYHGIPLEYRTEKEVFPNVRKYGQAYLPFSPLFQGLLAGKFLDGETISARDVRSANPKLSGPQFPFYRDIACRIRDFSAQIGHPMNEVALNWLRQKPEVTSIIAGASTLEQLEKNISAFRWNISADEMKKLDEIIAPCENM